jgi:UDP-N-acetyl-2-amino-2-deoxyglucuronate dehydrogenase
MIHLGIIGGGGISETHARAASEIEGVEIAAFSGRNQSKVELLAERFGARPFVDFDAFLKHDPLDAIVIGSPSGLHAEQGIAAAQRGLHVLVEKPIDVTTRKADALIDACEKAGVKLGVIYQDRVAPDLVRLKSLIDDETLGRILLVSGSVRWYRPPEYYGDSDWRGDPALAGGGALMSQGTHTVDLILWLLGGVERVQARSITALHQVDVEDTVVSTIEFRSGAIGTLEAATSAYPGYPRRLEISGSEGTIVIENDRIVRADLRGKSIDVAEPVESSRNLSASSPAISDVRGHRRILEDFVQAIKTGGPLLCDGREGRRSVELVQAIYESARAGRAVSVAGD